MDAISHDLSPLWISLATSVTATSITMIAGLAAAAWRQSDWLPSVADRAFVGSLMQQVTEPGRMAGWIAPLERGVNDRPIDYEYVRL